MQRAYASHDFLSLPVVGRGQGRSEAWKETRHTLGFRTSPMRIEFKDLVSKLCEQSTSKSLRNRRGGGADYYAH